jgi:hypothetical protein
MIKAKLKEDKVGTQISISTLSVLLKDIGYSYKAFDRRAHVVEQNHIRLWRRAFIQKLNENESCEHPKPIIYLDESWIDCNATAKKGWAPRVLKTKRDKLSHAMRVKQGKGPRLIMIHAGTISIEILFHFYSAKYQFSFYIQARKMVLLTGLYYSKTVQRVTKIITKRWTVLASQIGSRNRYLLIFILRQS